MATLLFTAVGTLVGGPLGGAIGALAGRQVDAAVIGGGSSQEGARLKDLQVTTSSYGTPIPRHFGQVRTAGTIIWATDLIENSDTQGGGKGKPQTTTFSYSVSFAVALSSKPIGRVGRIWADGNLLTDTAGSLSAGGSVRVYQGLGDQPVDPLIASDVGQTAPAFRDLAYAIFEDLPLGDFGNRIPALTFEVFSRDSGIGSGDLTGEIADTLGGGASFERLAGFSHEGGSVRAALSVLDAVYPMSCDISGEQLRLSRRVDQAPAALKLPETATVIGDRSDSAEEQSNEREGSRAVLSAVRYYDLQRDYQPSLQRASGRAAGAAARTLEFPGTLSASDAARVVDDAAARSRARADMVRRRIAELDPAIQPGSVVSLPDRSGRWIVESWEWYDQGIELELSRLRNGTSADSPGDSGTIAAPPDTLPWPTWLSAFELPWDGTGSPNERQVYIAASAGGAGWQGAAIYDAGTGALEKIAATSRARSIVGTLSSRLAPSPALTFESSSTLEIDLLAADMSLGSTDTAGLANGRNRMLVDGEILQFARAEQTGATLWTLTGLLRGRAGTEIRAACGHAASSDCILLDSNIQRLSFAAFAGSANDQIAAIGKHDQEPVFTDIDRSLTTRAPLSPVHPRMKIGTNNEVVLTWIRRTRGQWEWLPGVDVPLVESQEKYLIWIGDSASPARSWQLSSPGIAFDAAQWEDLAQKFAGQTMWVRQIGDLALSPPLCLHRFSIT